MLNWTCCQEVYDRSPSVDGASSHPSKISGENGGANSRNLATKAGRDGAQSAVGCPDRNSLIITQNQSFVTLHHLARQKEICALFCFTLEAVKPMLSPLTKVTPISLRKDSGHR